MGLVAATAGFFATGAYLGRDGSYGGGWLWFIAAFVCLIGLQVVARRADGSGLLLLFAFGVLIGLATAPTVAYYASADPGAVWQAGGATALLISAFGAAGYACRRDLSDLARWLLWALVGLLVFGITLIFVDLPNGSLIYSALSLAIFAGLTMFDFQRLRRERDLTRRATSRRVDLSRCAERLPVLRVDLQRGVPGLGTEPRREPRRERCAGSFGARPRRQLRGETPNRVSKTARRR